MLSLSCQVPLRPFFLYTFLGVGLQDPPLRGRTLRSVGSPPSFSILCARGGLGPSMILSSMIKTFCLSVRELGNERAPFMFFFSLYPDSGVPSLVQSARGRTLRPHSWWSLTPSDNFIVFSARKTRPIGASAFLLRPSLRFQPRVICDRVKSDDAGECSSTSLLSLGALLVFPPYLSIVRLLVSAPLESISSSCLCCSRYR